jgi:AcrR family transcriptional regulator
LLMQRDGPGERAGLVDEQIEVVVELGRDPEPSGEPVVVRDGLPVVRDRDLSGADLGQHPQPDEADRDRVPVLTDCDHRLRVDARAGVGISALYRRYGNKEGLLGALCADGLNRYVTEVEAALADPRDPSVVFEDFMRRAVDANTHSLTLSLAGPFDPDERLWQESARASELNQRFYAQMKTAGTLRVDIEVEDFALIFEQLAAIHGSTGERTTELRHRYLALILQALSMTSATSLPGPPPSAAEMSGRWRVNTA